MRPRKAVLTHFGMTMLEAHPREIAQEMTDELGVEVIAASDGMTLRADWTRVEVLAEAVATMPGHTAMLVGTLHRRPTGQLTPEPLPDILAAGRPRCATSRPRSLRADAFSRDQFQMVIVIRGGAT